MDTMIGRISAKHDASSNKEQSYDATLKNAYAAFSQKYLVAAPTGCVALQPGEITASVHVQEVWLRRVPNVHRDIVMAADEEESVRFCTHVDAQNLINLDGIKGKSNLILVS